MQHSAKRLLRGFLPNGRELCPRHCPRAPRLHRTRRRTVRRAPADDG